MAPDLTRRLEMAQRDADAKKRAEMAACVALPCDDQMEAVSPSLIGTMQETSEKLASAHAQLSNLRDRIFGRSSEGECGQAKAPELTALDEALQLNFQADAILDMVRDVSRGVVGW